MEAQILDGARYSEELRASIRKRVEALQTLHGIKTGLAVILVGNDPASHLYVKNKATDCAECGFLSQQIDLPADKVSGLKEAMKVLCDVEGVGICKLTQEDVVRHVMVQRIVKAYEDYEIAKNGGKGKK